MRSRVPNLDPPICARRGHVLGPDLVLKLGAVLAKPILSDFKLGAMGMIRRTRWHPMWIILGCGSCMPT